MEPSRLRRATRHTINHYALALASGLEQEWPRALQLVPCSP